MKADSKKHRWVPILIIAIVVLLAAFFCLCKFTDFGALFSSKSTDKQNDTYAEAIDVINNKLPTDVLVYGEDMDFRDGVKYSKISKLDDRSLSGSKKYTVLIINDMSGKVTLSDQELDLLKEKTKDVNFYFYYCGKNLIDKLVSAGIFDENTFQDGDLCCGYVTSEGEKIRYGGIYTENLKQIDDKNHNKEGLSELLLTNLLRCYKSNN